MPVLTESERVGTMVGGKYRLDRIVGRGGVGTVFAGVHAWTGREVAVKMLHVQYAEDRAVVDRFLVEARASATLRHPNVVDVLDMGKDDDGAVYMVLEYLEGESLARRLERRSRLEPDETAAILLPVMDALAEAHDLGIVHRDIKPENVFIALDAKRRTVPKLLDFGIAKVFAAGSARTTRTGTVVGTPAYMSPEQADGRLEVGPASDVWSMGVLLFECLTGGLPFPSDSPTATLVAILTTRPPSLRKVLPDVPVPLANAVDRALSRAPAERWADMRAFSAAILGAVGPAALQRPDPSGAFQANKARTNAPSGVSIRENRRQTMGKTLIFATGPVHLDDDGEHLRRELGRALSDAAGVEIEVVADGSYGVLAERISRGAAELAWLPPATFVRASEGGMIEQVYSSERAFGTRYQSALFVRADAAFDGVQALAGKRVAWVDRDSCAGYLFPKLELTELGRPPDALFAEQRFVESHMRVVRAVRDGDVDVGATFVQLRSADVRPSRPPELDDAAQRDLAQELALVGWAPFVAPAAMRPILVSRSIPSDALCVTKTMPAALRDTVRDVLVTAGDKPRLSRLFRGLMNADRFVPSDPSAYEPVRRAMQGARG